MLQTIIPYIFVVVAAGIQGWIESKYDISGKEYFFMLLAMFLFIFGGTFL